MSWLESMGKVESYLRDTGRLPVKNDRIPPHKRDPRQQEIENWLNTQRRNYDNLDAVQVERLEALPGFLWDPNTVAWKSNVKDFGDFYLKFGRWPLATSTDKREKRLAHWATEQRNLRRGASGRNAPTPERIAELEAIPGWHWGFTKAEQLQMRIDELAEFVLTHGRRPKSWRRVSRQLTGEEEREHSLSVWLAKRREIARKGLLGSETRERIEAALQAPLI